MKSRKEKQIENRIAMLIFWSSMIFLIFNNI